MALTFCPECGQPVGKSASTCSSCGYPLDLKEKQHRFRLGLFLVGLVLGSLWGALNGAAPAGMFGGVVAGGVAYFLHWLNCRAAAARRSNRPAPARSKPPTRS